MVDIDPDHVRAMASETPLNGGRPVPNQPDDYPRAPGALADGHRPTDAGNADRLVAVADGLIRYVHRWQKWIVYRDGAWQIDTGDALITEIAKQVPRAMFTRAAGLDPDPRDAMWKWARRSETAGAIAAMVRLARGIPGVLIDHHQLDQHPHLLNVRNGTIDLRSGRFLDHDPEHLLTMQAPVAYHPDATTTRWDACLQQWQPDPDMRAFLQRALGSGATGQPVDKLLVNIGGGANGKSACLGAIKRVLGPYVVVPDKSLFVQSRHEPHPTVRAALFGARLLLAPETERGARLAEAQVKEITGGDTITARRMHEDPWDFQPTWTAFMHSNHRPTIRGTDEGVWRRIRLVEWPATIPEHDRDPDLADKLAAEASGILNWLIVGAQAHLADGLDEPASVRQASVNYRQDEDHLGRFLTDCCTLGPGRYAMAADLRSRYEQWCKDEGEQPLAPKVVGTELRARGIEKAPSGTHRWLGIGIVADEAETP
jgi:putative DNA primase/helicase